jgi:hypothetical protein
VFLSDGSSKALQKRFAKTIVSNFFCKTIDQKSETDFFRFFVYHVFGRFSVRGVQKRHKKYRKIILTLVLFWSLTHPPTTGVTDLFLVFSGPLAQRQGASKK